MYTETLIYIQAMAKKVSDYGKLTPPITLADIYACVERLKGHVEEVDTLDVTSEGIVAKSEDDGFVIRLPKGMSNERKLLYTAKGIGYAFLHLNYPGPDNNNCTWLLMEPNFFFALDSEASDQAFEFAHALLQDGKSKYKFADKRKESV